MALPIKVRQDLPEPDRIASQMDGAARRDGTRELQALFMGARREQIGDFLHQIAQIEVDHLDGQLTRLDLGEVENVVDDGQERVGAEFRMVRA